MGWSMTWHCSSRNTPLSTTSQPLQLQLFSRKISMQSTVGYPTQTLPKSLAQSSKNSKQFFQQAIINSTPADSTCCILFEGAVLTWQFEHGNLASKACLREHSCPHNHLSLSGKNKGLRHNNKDQEVLNKGLSWMGGTNSSLPEKQFGLLWCHKFYSTNWINCDLLRY